MCRFLDTTKKKAPSENEVQRLLDGIAPIYFERQSHACFVTWLSRGGLEAAANDELGACVIVHTAAYILRQ